MLLFHSPPCSEVEQADTYPPLNSSFLFSLETSTLPRAQKRSGNKHNRETQISVFFQKEKVYIINNHSNNKQKTMQLYDGICILQQKLQLHEEYSLPTPLSGSPALCSLTALNYLHSTTWSSFKQ